jgi:hypothetical protein
MVSNTKRVPGRARLLCPEREILAQRGAKEKLCGPSLSRHKEEGEA